MGHARNAPKTTLTLGRERACRSRTGQFAGIILPVGRCARYPTTGGVQV